MSELYGDPYASLSSGGGRLIPDRLRRLAGAAMFLGLVAAMGLWAYRLGTRDAAEVPIIRAMEGPSRVQPADPGGLRAAHQGLEVNAVLAGQPAPVADASPPLPAPPAVLTDEDGPQGELVIAVPQVLPDAEPGPGEDLRMPLQEDAPAAVSPGALVALALGAEADADPLAEAIAASEPDAAGTRPLRRPAHLARAPAQGPAATPTAAREIGSVAAGARLVQLGAYDSEAITREAWSRLVARHGDLLRSKDLYLERTTANARVFYRLRVAGFDSADQTRAMCEALRARGVDCIPVTLQ